MLQFNIKILANGEGLPVPRHQTSEAAGLDLLAALSPDAPVLLLPMEYRLIPCGFCMQLPTGYEAQVRPRSGLALKHGISVLNAPGTIDSDYRGEVAVMLINYGRETYVVRRGDRIAQMVIARHESVELVPANDLDETKRGVSGYGSTG